jgi:protoheme IX farnesyltransferase
VPPLVGWAAVTGEVGWPAIVLFAVVFFWTPPHFWALSIRYRDDYARARVPMLPVVATLQETKKQIFWYAVVLLPVSLLLLATGTVGWIYGASAILLGAGFVRETWLLRSDDRPGAAMGVFRWSIYYLALLFAAVAADQLVLG